MVAATGHLSPGTPMNSSLSFTIIPFGLRRAIPGYGRLRDKSVLVGVILLDGAVAANNIKQLHGADHAPSKRRYALVAKPPEEAVLS